MEIMVYKQEKLNYKKGRINHIKMWGFFFSKRFSDAHEGIFKKVNIYIDLFVEYTYTLMEVI